MIVSIIVPVFNAEKSLHRCVASVLEQTFTDFELILIDDGSSDKSGLICDEYAEQDSRVRVFHKINGGVSSARNLGLDNACGKWVTFVDADDWVSKDYLKNLLVYSNDADLILNYATIYKNGEEKCEYYPEKIVDIINLSDLFKHNALIWHTSPWGKLFKRSIILECGLSFPLNMHIGEDAVFLFQYIKNTCKIRVICTCDYHYVINGSGSLTGRINDFKSEYCGYIQLLNISRELQNCFTFDNFTKKEFIWLLGSYLRRCLIALYHDDISKNQRMKFLKTQDFNNYLDGIIEDSIQGKVYKRLLHLRAFALYDVFRCALTKIGKK